MSLKYALLAALHEQPATGYDLTQNFKTRMANVWNASHQQIYRELAKMVEAGLLDVEEIEQASRPDRKVYRPSTAGLEALQQWLLASPNRGPTRDPLLVKLFAGDLLSAAALQREIDHYRQQWQQQLEGYLALETEYFSEPDAMPWHYRLQHLALRKGILSMEANLAWVTEIEGVLDSSPELTESNGK